MILIVKNVIFLSKNMKWKQFKLSFFPILLLVMYMRAINISFQDIRLFLQTK